MSKRKWFVLGLGILGIIAICIAAINSLRTYESIAIWLEGIALVAIFIWDRLDNRKQHKESQKQLEASLEQVEAGHKPFVAFSTAPRDTGDAVLDMGGAVGGMIVRCPGGNVEIGNIGYGPAVNVRYRATHNLENATGPGPSGYLADMVPGERFLTPIPRGILQAAKWEIVFTYESLSGRKYQTKCIVDDLVLTDVKFESVAVATQQNLLEPMGQQSTLSRFDKVVKALAPLGFLLALFSVGWQVYTYRESHEESPMVRASLTQELKGDHLQFNRDRHGELTVEVTNLGKRTMQIKNITLSAWKRVWVLHSPNEKPTFPLETGHTLSRQIEWDYVKYPIFALNDASQPADFLVEVETTRAVHQQHVQINSITVTSNVPAR